MKRKILSFLMIFLLIFTQVAIADVFYSDIEGNWAEEEILFATNELKIFTGYGDYTFRPNENITRSEFLAIITRVGVNSGIIDEIYTSDMNYLDMDITNWSYTHTITFYEHMKSNFQEYSFYDVFPGQFFYPEQFITREECVALIGVLVDNALYDNELSFSDINNADKYYEQVKILYNNDIIKGYVDNTIKLENNILRSEAAALIIRLYNEITYRNTKLDFELTKMYVDNQDVLPFFGDYGINTTDANEAKYLKAKRTLEELEFSGYIFPEDRHLYDEKPVETLYALREQDFPNIVGVNFYLLEFSQYYSISDEEKLILANELLENLLTRDDLQDWELIQIFELLMNYSVDYELYIDALENWYNKTEDDNVKFNIKVLLYNSLMQNNKTDEIISLAYNDIQAGTDYEEMLEIDFNFLIGETIDFSDLTDTYIYFTMYEAENFEEMHDETRRIIIVGDYVYAIEDGALPFVEIENSETNENSITSEVTQEITTDVDKRLDISLNIENEEMFINFSMNKLKILRYIEEYNRGFIESINDFEIIKKLEIYNENEEELSLFYNSIVRFFKDTSNILVE